MQQICRTCENEFDGPATCVGSNLCPNCEFADLSHRWKHAPGGMFPGERTCLLTLQQEEIERLREDRDEWKQAAERMLGACTKAAAEAAGGK